MSNLEKKEPLTALISIKTTENMKKELEKIAIDTDRDFSNLIRFELKLVIEKYKKSGIKNKNIAK